MILGVLGDTHDCGEELIHEIVEKEFRPRGVEVIVHTGDIISKYVDARLFGDFPTICVLTKHQAFDFRFSVSPQNWRFVRPAFPEDQPRFMGHCSDPEAEKYIEELEEFCMKQRVYARLVPITSPNGERLVAYCGHERSFDLFKNPQKVADFFAEINQVYDGVNLAMTGHTHHQFVFRHGPITWVNPGAVAESMNKTHEFAVINTRNKEVVLGRLSGPEAKVNPVTVGIVSDPGNVDQIDSTFWQRLRQEFELRGVSQAICCGNFRPEDIGRPEFDGLQVHYYLLPEYSDGEPPPNWRQLLPENPTVEIGGHRFYVQHGIGPEHADFSEIQRHDAFGWIFEAYKHIDFIVAGLAPGTILQETDSYSFINPGDARDHKYFATVCLPRREYTLGTVRA
jgi:predicted phosphodiesterase